MKNKVILRPVSGLLEQIKSAGKTCAMFYGWEPLRDVSRPGSLIYAGYPCSFTENRLPPVRDFKM